MADPFVDGYSLLLGANSTDSGLQIAYTPLRTPSTLAERKATARSYRMSNEVYFSWDFLLMHIFRCGAVLLGMFTVAFPALAGQRVFTPDTVVNPAAFYPEGPQLIDQGLLVAEMPKHRVVLIKHDGRTETVWTREGCGPTSIKRIPKGGYWILCHLGHYVARLDDNFRTTRTFTTTAARRPIARPNDGSVDAAGNLYFSSPSPFSLDAPPGGFVTFLEEKTGTATDLAGGLRYSNGVLVQETQRRLLISEHLNRRVIALTLDSPGIVSAPRIFFDFQAAPLVPSPYPLSGPDGIAAFADGELLVADYGNGRLLHLSADGAFIQAIPVQYPYVTNMAIMPDQHSMFVLMTESNTAPPLHGIVQRFTISEGKPAP